MNYEQIDRIEMKQLDVSDTSKEGKERVEEDLNSFIAPFEKNGYQVVDQSFMPELNGTRAIMNIFFGKKEVVEPIRYCYMVVDSRNGHDVASRVLNAEVLKLKKEGKKIVKQLSVPKRNAAFCQILLAYVPSENETPKPEKAVEKPKEEPKEVKKDVEKFSEAITA